MKIKKRLAVAVSIIAAALLGFASLHAAAAEELTVTETEALTVSEKIEEAVADGVGSSSADSELSDESKTDSNVFTELYDKAMANMDKILSLLAFIASLFVGIIYKKRLIPTLSLGINEIGESISSFKEGIRTEEEERSRELCSMREELSSLENSTRIVSEELEQILARLEEIIPKRAAEERTRIIMSAQVDLLYDVFMSSALPEYMKDDVGRRITEMREELDKGNEEKV